MIITRHCVILAFCVQLVSDSSCFKNITLNGVVLVFCVQLVCDSCFSLIWFFVATYR